MQTENSEIFQSSTLSDISKNYLLETTRWTKFLSVLGLIFIGLMLVFLITLGFSSAAFGTISPEIPGMARYVVIVVFFLFMLLYFYPVYMLFQFSNHIKNGIKTNNQELLDNGFRCQKNLYKFMGIFTIVLLSFYVIAFGFAIVQAIV